MPKHEWYNLLLHLWWLLFVTANGACIGSLINVLVYRLPRGISVIWPASACPQCHTKLGWRENFPILGWVLLRGRCRTCRNPISPEYPLVEVFTAFAFGLVFVILAWMPRKLEWLGLNVGAMRPEWAWNMAGLMWPTIVLVLILVACLIAMTIVDLKTFTIPAPLTTVPTVLALVIHPLHAAWLSTRMGGGASRAVEGVSGRPRLSWAPGYWWSIPTADSWRMVLLAGGAAAGLALAYGLLRVGVLKRSFSDYEEWERTALGAHTTEQAAAGAGSVEAVAVETEPEMPGVLVGEQMAPMSVDQVARVMWTVLIIAALGMVGAMLGPLTGLPQAAGLGVGLLVGPIVAGFVFGRAMSMDGGDGHTRRSGGQASAANEVGASDATLSSEAITTAPPPRVPLPPAPATGAEVGAGNEAMGLRATEVVGTEGAMTVNAGAGLPEFENPAEAWIAYPHARREMVRELAYLAPAAILAYVGWHAPAWMGLEGSLPHWLSVLGGVVLGYLIGGGVVWLVRILGSLAAGKEAMGLGDVHMMAAVGACLGWIDATLAFLVAAFVGIYFVGVQLAWTRTAGRAMPYGPYLAIATVLVFLGKPWVEQGLGELVQRRVNLP